ncbi:MAG: asparagine synthase (glutamine-hydrolyzing) [Ignavibacteria bacterium]|nr:asparagine synthase (glutamine-hydrolyzing) [Ignavibacteria bacterium]
MCGINGILSADSEFKIKISVMNKLLRHRGPDDEGFVLINSKSGKFSQFSGNDSAQEIRLTYPIIDNISMENIDIVFGHRRLSIIDLSKNGHGPMGSADGKIWVTFNGEIYNYIELRDELIRYGYKFYTKTDTEVIINSFAHWGINCLNKFNGMWAFALWDSNTNSLYLCRDRFGIKPLYYTHTKDFFAFSSEIKPIVYLTGRSPEINSNKIPFYILNGNRLNTDDTYIKGIYSLPSSHYLVFKNDRSETIQYYEIPIRKIKNKSEDTLAEEIVSLLKDSIKLRFRSDVPVGTCLSGGFDSSSIVSLSSELISGKLSTFSAVWKESECDESRYIDIVNDRYGCIPNKVDPSADEFVKVFNRINYFQEIPSEGPGLYPQWFVMQEAKGKVKVLLDGQGGDELFGGYFLIGAYLRGLIKDRKYSMIAKEYKSFARYFRENGLHSFAGWLFPKQYGLLTRSMLSKKHNMINEHLWEQVGHGSIEESKKPPKSYGNFFSDLAFHFIRRQTLPALLHYEDRNSMAHSIESRVPFLDYRLVELGINLEPEHLTDRGLSRPLYRKALQPYLPYEVVGRKDKLGFPVPFTKLTRTLLKDYVMDTILNSKAGIYEYADMKQVTKNLEDHFSETKDFGWIIWRLLSLESILNMYKNYNFN